MVSADQNIDSGIPARAFQHGHSSTGIPARAFQHGHSSTGIRARAFEHGHSSTGIRANGLVCFCYLLFEDVSVPSRSTESQFSRFFLRFRTFLAAWLFYWIALSRIYWMTQSVSRNYATWDFFQSRMRRSGVTLIELLTVMVILWILGSISLLAIIASRSKSQSLICQNNLRQIGLATIEYCDATKRIPFGPRGRGFVGLLSYLGHTAHYERIKTSDLLTSELDQPPVVFACPSDSENSPESVFGRASNYLPCGGRASYGQRKNSTGFAWSRTLADVRDGLSNTIFYSERLTVQNSQYFNFSQRVKWGGIMVHQFVSNEAEFDAACWENYKARDPIFLSSGYAPTLLTVWHPFGTKHPPNSVTCFFVEGRAPPELLANDDVFSATANSLHSGTVNTVFGDGAVRVIGDDINPQLWTAFGTISGRD